MSSSETVLQTANSTGTFNQLLRQHKARSGAVVDIVCVEFKVGHGQ